MFGMVLVFFPFPVFTSTLLTCSRCSLFPTGCLCCTTLPFSIRIQKIIKIRKSTNRLKKSWIVSMMWRVLQERANGSATSKPYNWSYPRHMKKKPNKTRLRNNIKLSKVITICTPGRKRHQNGPMIYVHSPKWNNDLLLDSRISHASA